MYKVKKSNGEALDLDREQLNDFVVETLRSRGADNDEISEVKESIDETPKGCQCDVSFDEIYLFSVHMKN